MERSEISVWQVECDGELFVVAGPVLQDAVNFLVSEGLLESGSHLRCTISPIIDEDKLNREFIYSESGDNEKVSINSVINGMLEYKNPDFPTLISTSVW